MTECGNRRRDVVEETEERHPVGEVYVVRHQERQAGCEAEDIKNPLMVFAMNRSIVFMVGYGYQLTREVRSVLWHFGAMNAAVSRPSSGTRDSPARDLCLRGKPDSEREPAIGIGLRPERPAMGLDN